MGFGISWDTMVLTIVVCVNGLGLTLRVSVNPIMKFIYTPSKCKRIIFIYIHINVKYEMCKCKINIFIWFYMAMENNVNI
jgi:hypothetical protein